MYSYGAPRRYARLDDIESLSEAGIEVYAPMVKSKKGNRPPEQARWSDGPGVAAWRVRMTTAEAKEIYKERASTAECVNALARNRGLRQVLVGGLEQVRRALLWFALAHNMLRGASLRAGAAYASGEPHVFAALLIREDPGRPRRWPPWVLMRTVDARGMPASSPLRKWLAGGQSAA